MHVQSTDASQKNFKKSNNLHTQEPEGSEVDSLDQKQIVWDFLHFLPMNYHGFFMIFIVTHTILVIIKIIIIILLLLFLLFILPLQII